MKPLILIATICCLQSAALAGGAPPSGNSGGRGGSTGSANANAVAPNQAQNSQSAVGNINQSPVGGVNNNTQFNNAANTDYGFGNRVVCRGAHLGIGGFSNMSGNFNSFGGIVSLNVPLGGQIGSTCATLAKEILQQRQLDTCITLIKNNIVADPAVFPELARC
jgi:hypothetical protein